MDTTGNNQIAEVHFNKGNANSNISDHTGAIVEYTKALETNPELAEAYINRGLAKVNLQDFEGAIDDYTMAIEIEPRSAELPLKAKGGDEMNMILSDCDVLI